MSCYLLISTVNVFGGKQQKRKKDGLILAAVKCIYIQKNKLMFLFSFFASFEFVIERIVVMLLT